MGIPGLLSSIGPYAKEEKWTQSEIKKETTGLVIDGPAFAYYIYYRCLTQMHAEGHALSAVPNYQFLVQTARLWLECIEKYGLVVKHIFFDGALPFYKYRVRHERLQKSIDQMRAYKLLNPDLPSAYKSRAHTSKNQNSLPSPAAALLGHGSHVPSGLKAIPAATFLVPALLEYLLGTSLSKLVHVVPCEADLMCTSRDFCTESDIVLTSDSDLVLQDPPGRIVFFNSLYFTDPALDGSFLVLNGQSYLSKQICSRLKLQEDLMVLMGYHLSLDCQAGLVECSKRAVKGLLVTNEDYLAFRAQYHPWATLSSWDDVFSSKGCCSSVEDYVRSDASNLASAMDPRILEFIVATKEDPRETSSPHMFLPPLLDDPARSSAWNSSAPLRHMAYSLWMQGRITTENIHFRIYEIDRRGIRLGQNIIEVERFDVTGSYASPPVRNLMQELTRLTGKFQSDIGDHGWAKIVLLLFLWSGSGNLGNEKLPARHDIATLVARGSMVEQKSVTWSLIHLIAQIDAWYYSLRIFKQILSLIEPSRLLEDILEQWRKLLSSMPAIADLLTSPTRGPDFGPPDDNLYQELGKFYPGFDAELNASPDMKKSKRSRNKRKSSHEQMKPQAGVKAPRNMYSLLSDDD